MPKEFKWNKMLKNRRLKYLKNNKRKPKDNENKMILMNKKE
tara:strand:- start:378 stop:500 length:123 start_codon:yes stop_codon:yes gene_type:complete